MGEGNQSRIAKIILLLITYSDSSMKKLMGGSK